MIYKLAAGAGIRINQLTNFVKINSALGSVKVEATAFQTVANELGSEQKQITLRNVLKGGQSIDYGVIVNGVTITNLHNAEQTIDIETAFGIITDNMMVPAIELVTGWRGTFNNVGVSIVSPLQNLSGVIVHAAGLAYNAAAGSGRLVAGTSVDHAKSFTGITLAHLDTVNRSAFNIALPFKMPAGSGIYAVSDTAAILKGFLNFEIL